MLDDHLGVGEREGLIVRISYHPFDSDWEKFLESTPGEWHMQSCLWSAFKAHLSWSPIRIIVKEGHSVMAGAQVLVRQLPFGLMIGRIPQGPVFGRNDPKLFNTVLDCLLGVIRDHKINYLAFQPDLQCGTIDELKHWGFQVSSFLGDERANIVIDLSQPLEIILQGMRGTTRYNIRLAEKREMTVREGTYADLSVFYELLKATGRRQKFIPRSYSYYTALWQQFEPGLHVKLFLVEHKGETISGLLALALGDTAVAEGIAWSGKMSPSRPNELLIWSAIKWAKDKGYPKFDMGGIDLEVARALLSGRALPESMKSGHTMFKIGFGGTVMLLPPTFEYISHRAIRLMVRQASSILGKRNLSIISHESLAETELRIRKASSLLSRSRE